MARTTSPTVTYDSFRCSTSYSLYAQNFIIAVLGVPGAFLSAWTVELPWLGRRGTLAASSGKYLAIL
jgi:hypothetical protein